MYLIFPPELEGLAKAVLTKATSEYPYTTAHDTVGLVNRPVAENELIVTIYDMEQARKNEDIAEFRWSVLDAMSQGGVFVYFDRESTPNFYDEKKDRPVEEQIDGIIQAGRYTHARLKAITKRRGKAEYVGPTFVDPLLTVVVTYDAKKENFDLDYDERVRVILSSLQEDAWTNTSFATARMGATLKNFLEGFYETAIFSLDKKGTSKVDSLLHEQVKPPKNIDLIFGRTLLLKAKRKEVDDV